MSEGTKTPYLGTCDCFLCTLNRAQQNTAHWTPEQWAQYAQGGVQVPRHVLLNEIDHLRTENAELKKLLGECEPEVEEFWDFSLNHSEEEQDDPDIIPECYPDCRKCYVEKLLARIHAAIGEGK
jgi:hypothetical protein